MNLSKRYIALLCISLVPQLAGCLQTLHVKGEMDVTTDEEMASPKGEVSTTKEPSDDII